MNIRSSFELHFHQQEQVSVYLETTASGLEQELGEIALFTCLSVRILCNLGVNDTSDTLARFLANSSQGVKEFASGTSTGGFELINYPGYKGRKRFTLNLKMSDSEFNFDLAQNGFGFLARGYGFYAPVAVCALLRFLAVKHSQQNTFLSSLGQAAEACGHLHLQRRITLGNQRELGMAVLAGSCGDNYLSHIFPS
jgi:hypothetical protein